MGLDRLSRRSPTTYLSNVNSVQSKWDSSLCLKIQCDWNRHSITIGWSFKARLKIRIRKERNNVIARTFTKSICRNLLFFLSSWLTSPPASSPYPDSFWPGCFEVFELTDPPSTSCRAPSSFRIRRQSQKAGPTSSTSPGSDPESERVAWARSCQSWTFHTLILVRARNVVFASGLVPFLSNVWNLFGV